MVSIQYYDVILKPLVTEKSMAGMAEKGCYFLVRPEANKTMIKKTVEKTFADAKVKSANTINRPTKTRRGGMTIGQTAKSKKAIVQLAADSKEIKIFQGL